MSSNKSADEGWPGQIYFYPPFSTEKGYKLNKSNQTARSIRGMWEDRLISQDTDDQT